MIIENTTLYNIVDSDVKEGELTIPDGITDVNLELFATHAKKEDAERLKKRRNKNLYDKRKNPKEPEL